MLCTHTLESFTQGNVSSTEPRDQGVGNKIKSIWPQASIHSTDLPSPAEMQTLWPRPDRKLLDTAQPFWLIFIYCSEMPFLILTVSFHTHVFPPQLIFIGSYTSKPSQPSHIVQNMSRLPLLQFQSLHSPRWVDEHGTTYLKCIIGTTPCPWGKVLASNSKPNGARMATEKSLSSKRQRTSTF